MAAVAADRNLLFGLLALQVGLIDQGQLVAAFQAWTRDKARALADHLVGRGDLSRSRRELLDALVEEHLKEHGGDAERSLAVIPAGRSTRDSLAQLGDPDIEGSLAQVGSASSQHDGEPDPSRTLTHSFGTVTSGGQRFRVLRPHARGGLGAVFAINCRAKELRRTFLDCTTPEKVKAVEESLYELAVGGDVAAARLWLEHAIGRPLQSVEIGGPGGTALGVQVLMASVLAALAPHPEARLAVAAKLKELPPADEPDQPADPS